jgi:cleavage stimulation factor subunit 2
MSRNGYSIRDRGSSRNELPDKRQRRDSGSNSFSTASSSIAEPVDSSRLSTANASSVLFVGGFPPDWTEKIVESVVAGSGHIVDIRPRIDPGGRKNFCFVEYESPGEAENALKLLSDVTIGPRRKIRVELSKEGLRTSRPGERPALVLDRQFLPSYVNLPPLMRNNTKYVKNADAALIAQPSISPVPHTPPQPVQLAIPEIPEVLSKASKYLPQFNPDAFKSEDKISENLQAIPPVQLIELLSTLKNLIGKNDITSAQQVFNMAPAIPIAVSQALILMGLIDLNILTAGLQTVSNHNTPQPQSAIPSYSNAPPPPPRSIASHPLTQPGWEGFSYQTVEKLSKLDPNEAAMISQVLRLSPQDISNLPQQQLSVVSSIRAQYL